MNPLIFAVALCGISTQVFVADNKAPKLKCMIVKVNSEDKKINVTVNIGKDDGVFAGDEFRVYRNNKPIAIIELTEVEPEQCKAKITEIDKGKKLKPGDNAVRIE